MKKILFLILLVLISFIGRFEAKAQCAACLVPNICTSTTINIPGCGNVTYYICYHCSITNNSMTADILEVDGVCPGYEDAAWDAGYQWIFNNKAALCGTTPCTNPTIITVTKPICADMVYHHLNPGVYNIVTNSAGCDLRCSQQFSWCYCNCTPDCYTPGCIPHNIVTPIGSPSPTGNGSCTFTSYNDGGYYDTNAAYDWTITCQRFDDCH